MTLKVPVGTVIRDLTNDRLLSDLTHHGQRLEVAKGGKGGLGNINFKAPPTARRVNSRQAKRVKQRTCIWNSRCWPMWTAGDAQRGQVHVHLVRSLPRARKWRTIRSPRCIRTGVVRADDARAL